MELVKKYLKSRYGSVILLIITSIITTLLASIPLYFVSDSKDPFDGVWLIITSFVLLMMLTVVNFFGNHYLQERLELEKFNRCTAQLLSLTVIGIVYFIIISL